MLKAKIISRVTPVAVWLVIMSLIKWRWGLELIGLWVGGVIGAVMIESDHLVYLLWQQPDEPNSQSFKKLLVQKQYRQALDLAMTTASQRIRLPFHNVLFQAVFVPFSFLVISSSGSAFGIGLVMAMSLSLLVNQVILLAGNRLQELGSIYFWPVQREVGADSKQWYVVIMVFLFLLFSYFLV